MSNDDTVDFGSVSTDPQVRHLAVADVTNTKITEVRETVSRIEDKVDHLTNKVDHLIGLLNGLGREISRLPSGVTLINAVGQILDKVNEL